MSLHVESVEELQQLIKKLGIKVNSVDELRSLMATINACYDPDVARNRAARLVGIVVPCVALGVAGLVSIVLAGTLGTPRGHAPADATLLLVALGIVWGVAGLTSAVAAVGSLLFLRGGRGVTIPQAAGSLLDALRGEGQEAGQVVIHDPGQKFRTGIQE
jgi:hypothetical protein